ncbi:MAG: HutD family protein, partial [Proteobacteria bacterium]
MSGTELLTPDRYSRAKWKNGLGHTDQIAIYPENADLRKSDFLWRISTARIENSSDFSIFPDHDRNLIVLEGQGMRLTHTFPESDSADTVELPKLEPYEFPGDVPSRCELMGGPIQD